MERDIARDREAALESNIATAPGPLPTRLSSYPATSLDPVKIERIFRSADLGVGIYEYGDLCKQMRERDAHLLGIDRQRRLGVANKDYLLRPSDEGDAVSIALASMMRIVVRGIDNFPLAVYESLSKNCDGWSLSELVWRRGTIRFRVPTPDGIGKGTWVSVNGLWPRQFSWVHPKHTEFDTRRGDVPLLNVGSKGAIRLPRHKFVYTRALGEGIASARGYSRSVVWMHFFKHASMRDWVVFLHLYGIPFLQGKMDRNLWKDAAMKATLREALENYGTGETRPILPQGLEIAVSNPVSVSGSGDAHSKMWGVCCAEQSKAVLGVTLTTEASSGGAAYALGYVHADAAHEVKVADSLTTASDLASDVHLAAIEANADVIARALSDAGLSVKPWELPLRVPFGFFRTDREWSPEVRQRILQGLQSQGLPLSAAQLRHVFDADAPHDEQDTISRTVMPPIAGGAEQKSPAPPPPLRPAPQPEPSDDGEQE